MLRPSESSSEARVSPIFTSLQFSLYCPLNARFQSDPKAIAQLKELGYRQVKPESELLPQPLMRCVYGNGR